jgi:hypothetical protein
LLLLFDDINIKIFKKSKKVIRKLAKAVDESETWVQNLAANTEHMVTLTQTKDQFEFFTELLFQRSFLDDKEPELVKAPTQEIDPIRQDIMRHLKVDRLAV